MAAANIDDSFEIMHRCQKISLFYTGYDERVLFADPRLRRCAVAPAGRIHLARGFIRCRL
jgi:hypothetical protein